ncbi:MAG: acyl-CoA desaturase [Acidimicrobiales bacterium]
MTVQSAPPVEAGPVEGGPVEARPRAGRAGSWRLGIPFVLVHLACLTVVVVGWSPVALSVCVMLYLTRAFGITGFYHRCFSHRAFRTTRPVQFAGAVLGAAAAQRGPLWWVAHHRVHHKYTDRPGDVHSPRVSGAAWSHVLWIFAPANQATDLTQVPDLARFPELRFLDRFHHLVPAVAGLSTFGLGVLLGWAAPGLHTSGPQMFVWGFAISTVALYHSTFAVNSVAHRFGRRRFDTRDDSRNNWLVSLLVLGEGWHNNHHRYPMSARQGFARWELDPTWMAIRALASLRLASDLRPVPDQILQAARARPGL